MRTQLASARVVGELARVDLDVERLRERWQRGEEVPLSEFWRECHPRPDAGLHQSEAVHLGALIKADLRRRFERGEAAGVSEYLERFPELDAFGSRVISLIYEEFCLREERGEHVDVSEFCARYPRWKDSLPSQLNCHRIFSQAAGLAPPRPRYPEPGSDFEEFQLLSVIGKGGSSRVYLARDRSLGGKRVVLKISLDRGQEPKTQGALDHPHIVPVNSVVFETETELRGLSMPFRPGLPLDEVVKRLGPDRQGRRALSLWRALADGLAAGDLPLSDEQQAGLLATAPAGDGWKGFPVSGSFAQGAAWIALVLARTLDYAHRMKTFHRDVKPGNVLLTLQHGPQLLDFNLADSPHSAKHAESAMLGGTLPYMAPEQIEAFLDPDQWNKVDARADLYSLGLLLRELLTGKAPDLPDEKLPPARAMRELLDRRSCLDTDVGRYNPEVPPALRSIVDRCLRFDPEARYPDARSLAEDLQCFLDRRPLVTADNPSGRELASNWLYRNRRDLGVASVIVLLAGMVAYPWILAWSKADPANHPLMHQAAVSVRAGRAHEAIKPLRSLVEAYPGHPLPRTYLGIVEALSTGFVENDAHLDVDRGLGLPTAERALLDWGRFHPDVVGQIGRYVDRQRDYLNGLKSKHAVQHEEDRAIERKFHETWLRLINLGLKLAPNSAELRNRLPSIHEYFGDYERAHQLLTQIIEPLRANLAPEQASELLEWTAQRNRVAVQWSRKLLGGHRPEDARRALELMQQASNDLSAAEPFVSSIGSQLGGPQRGNDLAQLVYRYLWIATESCLMLGEVQQAQGQDSEADAAFRRAHRHYRNLVSLGDAYLPEQPHAALEELKSRVLKAIGRKPAQSH
ncbi:MAG: serine/threonine-protein kinase [Isosphaeraceae bacterium]